MCFNTVLFMMLALGLNVVVGWGGLLDLGYLMFYGFGALTYANLRSDQFDLHWPTLARDRDRDRRGSAVRDPRRPAVEDG